MKREICMFYFGFLIFLLNSETLTTFIIQKGYVVFDGDMLMTPSRASEMYFRSGRAESKFLWPNKTVNYILDKSLNAYQKDEILDVMKNIGQRTCVKFYRVPKLKINQTKHIKIKTGERGCWSFVGYQNIPEQTANFGSKCFLKKGVIYHEIFHSLGLFHMQNSYDRDKYIKILWDNIKDDMKQNFGKYDASMSSDFAVPYDYESVMHYSKRAFSKNNRDTIKPLKKISVEMGQRVRPTPQDYQRVNNMYQCKEQQKIQTKSTDVEDILEIAEFKSLDNPKIVTPGKESEENNSKLTLPSSSLPPKLTAQTTNDVNLVVEDTTAADTKTTTITLSEKGIEAITTKSDAKSIENQIELVIKTTERFDTLGIKNTTRMGTTTLEPVKSLQGTTTTIVEEPNTTKQILQHPLHTTSTSPKSTSDKFDPENLNTEVATMTTTGISTATKLKSSTTIDVVGSTEILLKTLKTNGNTSPQSATKIFDSYASNLATETTTTATQTVESLLDPTESLVEKPDHTELTSIIYSSSTPENTIPYNLNFEDTTAGITTTTKSSTVVTESKEINEVIEPPLKSLRGESTPPSLITQSLKSKGSKDTETVATTISSTIYFTKEPETVDEQIEMVSQTSEFKTFSTNIVETSNLNNIFLTTESYQRFSESSHNHYNNHEKNLNTNSNNNERGKYFCKSSIIPRTCRFVKKIIGGAAKKIFGIIGNRRSS